MTTSKSGTGTLLLLTYQSHYLTLGLDKGFGIESVLKANIRTIQ